MSKKLEWSTVQRKVNDLIPLDINPRKISESKRMKMIESLQRFNLVDIPVADFDNTVVSGHQRLRAMQAIGRGDEVIDVRYPNRKLTGTELKEYNLLGNTHFGEWDNDVFEEYFGDVDVEGLGFSADDFKLPDLSIIAPEPEQTPIKLEAKEDNYEVPGQIVTDIVSGDLFEIGPHRLLCGDSTNADDVARLMDGKAIELVVTDPPYGVSYVGKTDDALTIENDSMSETETFDLWRSSLSALWPFWNEGAALYATVPPGPLHIGFVQELKNLDVLRQSLVWNKSSMVLGHSDYHYKHEPILYGWKPGAAHYFTDDRTQTTVLDVEKPAANREHPTMKPIKLWEIFIKNSSKEKWNVYDPFLGSGTTMVAAHQLSRRCYGMEISPLYCQVIMDRMLRLDPSLTITRNGKAYEPQR